MRQSIEIKKSKLYEIPIFMLEGLSILMIPASLLAMTQVPDVGLKMFVIFAPTAAAMHLAHKKKFNLKRYNIEKLNE